MGTITKAKQQWAEDQAMTNFWSKVDAERVPSKAIPCTQGDPERWYSYRGLEESLRDECWSCPVQVACLETRIMDAEFTHGEPFDFKAGMTPMEQRRIKGLPVYAVKAPRTADGWYPSDYEVVIMVDLLCEGLSRNEVADVLEVTPTSIKHFLKRHPEIRERVEKTLAAEWEAIFTAVDSGISIPMVSEQFNKPESTVRAALQKRKKTS